MRYSCMMSPKNTKRQLIEDDDATMDISSLIDVCFLLLIFFLVTATIQPRESDLPMKLPTPDGVTAPVEDLVLSLQLDQEGQLVMKQGDSIEVLDSDVDNRRMAGLERKVEVMKVAAAPHDLIVHLNVNDDTSQQRFIDVMNGLVGLEVDKIMLADIK